MSNHVLFCYHNEIGHVEVEKLLKAIRQTCWLPKLREKCANYVRNCLKSISFPPVSGKPEGFHNPIANEEKPLNMVHIDHCGHLDHRVLSKTYMFLIIDTFTKFSWLCGTNMTNIWQTLFNCFLIEKVLFYPQIFDFKLSSFLDASRPQEPKNMFLASCPCPRVCVCIHTTFGRISQKL